MSELPNTTEVVASALYDYVNRASSPVAEAEIAIAAHRKALTDTGWTEVKRHGAEIRVEHAIRLAQATNPESYGSWNIADFSRCVVNALFGLPIEIDES